MIYFTRRVRHGCLLRTLIIALFFSSSLLFAQNVVRYDLHVGDMMVDFSGKSKRAISVNGQIPMPTLTFTEGDTAEIHVYNELDEPTALHWHGLFVPNREDGVPYLTQMPIAPHTEYVYRFPIIQNGTYWYHSHHDWQEQIGMYGAIMLKKKPMDTTFRKGIDDAISIPVVLSDWSDYLPRSINRMLHTDADWFAIKKNSVQSYAEAIRAGHFKSKIVSEWKRMLAMDISDVYYHAFLMNGKKSSSFPYFKQGDKVRLRIANGGAGSYFWLQYAGGKITVVANDGNDVEPVEVDRLIIGVSETYDVIVSIPHNDTSYEFSATAEDRTGGASLYLGAGRIKNISPLKRLNYFEGMDMMNDMTNMRGDILSMEDMEGMRPGEMDMNALMYPELDDTTDIETLNYSMLSSTHKTTLSKNAPIRELRFELTGNMNRYIWSINNKMLSQADRILIKKGENVRIILFNKSMMRHPMHLHGHDFRLLNGKGERSPLKNVLDIMPGEQDTIEFSANTDGDWFFHCHLLYHMMSGMGRIFSYQGSPHNPLIHDPVMANRMLLGMEKRFYFSVENDFATNGNDGMLSFQNFSWMIATEWRLGYNDINGYETETHIGRYIGKMQWFMPFIGFDWRYRDIRAAGEENERNLFGQKSTKNERHLFSIGAEYALPMLIKLSAEIYHDGGVRLQLRREDIPISRRARMDFMVNTDKEYMLGLRYVLFRNIVVGAHYDSDMGVGFGIKIKY